MAELYIFRTVKLSLSSRGRFRWTDFGPSASDQHVLVSVWTPFPLYRKTARVPEGSAGSFSPFLFSCWGNEEAAPSEAVITDTLVSECVCGPKAGVKKRKDTEGVPAFCVPAWLRTIFEGFGGLRAFIVFSPSNIQINSSLLHSPSFSSLLKTAPDACAS